MKRVGLLGCGTIGSAIALAIESRSIHAELTHIYDASRAAAESLASRLPESRPEITSNPNLLFTSRTDIIVEAAAQQALRDSALAVIQNRKDLMIMSVGALLDDSIHDVIFEAAREFGTRIIIPSGAIAGLDGIRAVRAKLERVTLTTTKHPDSLRGAPFFGKSDVTPDGITSPTVLYEGPAVDAVSLFPANVNVAAALSLAGIGGSRTTVRMVADPNTDKNTHRVEASGAFGRMTFEIENVPSPTNPKTSWLAVLSAVEALGGYCSDDVRSSGSSSRNGAAYNR